MGHETLKAPEKLYTNKAEDIIATWTAMEILSPQTFKKPEKLAPGEQRECLSLSAKGQLPWENGGEKAPKDRAIFYQIILGSIKMQPAIEELFSVYSDSLEERSQVAGEAAIATLTVDQFGCLVEKDPIDLSSFSWGLPVALKGKLADLKFWKSKKPGILIGLREQLTRLFEDTKAQPSGHNSSQPLVSITNIVYIGDQRNPGASIDCDILSDEVNDPDTEHKRLPSPLNREDINRAFSWLIDILGLDKKYVTPPSLAIRIYQYVKPPSQDGIVHQPEPPEPLIMNSFYLEDLERAHQLFVTGNEPTNLSKYLLKIHPIKKQCMLTDQAALEDALRPELFPLGAWPSKGRHPLAVLQQCVVNLSIKELESGGILAVNGPPGTGKTTLLRDIISAIITQRAEALCNFDDPETAFSKTGIRRLINNSWLTLYQLDEQLLGSEIIVASSNNKAVENVSAELPIIEAIAEGATDLRHFKTLADRLLGREAWGLIAAVLGNSSNRHHFKQTFWMDKNFGLKPYLFHCSASSKKKATEELPSIITQEDPPSDKKEALSRWQKARGSFKIKLEHTQKALMELQRIRDLGISIRANKILLHNIEQDLLNLTSRYEDAEHQKEAAIRSYSQNKEFLDSAIQHCEAMLASRPGFWHGLFKTSTWRLWEETYRIFLGQLSTSQSQSNHLKNRINENQKDFEQKQQLYMTHKNKKELAETTIEKDEALYRDLLKCHQGAIIDDNFLALPHEQKQKTIPWVDAKVAELRTQLFAEAMALHKAFIDAAATPIRQNLGILMNDFGTSSIGTREEDDQISHLWSTLFLVVPVISTTFASVARMFCKVNPEKFGWLLIDEAGQALPQAAVGAIMRTQRAVVVGDPLQIEPVMILPENLTKAMCRKFDIDPMLFNPPSASVQTLSDQVSPYGTILNTSDGQRELGLPLLVHRRCSDPMFTISNKIAYGNLMVQAKAPKPSGIKNILGSSQWFDVQGIADDKWCPQEGEMVLSLLKQLRKHNCLPDLYIVTPFQIVQARMRNLVLKSGILKNWVEAPDSWAYERIGTVHTVQGREAEAIIFVLGAPDIQQRGARDWAGKRPNILNVAATRAKEVLYVVGNRSLWKKAGLFKELEEALK